MVAERKLKQSECQPLGCVRAATIALSLFVAGCVPVPPVKAASDSTAPHAMRWDHQPGGSEWTLAALQAVAARDPVLAARVPSDIEAWCPGYAEADIADRRSFWVGLLSAVAKHESSWNAAAAGGGGRWIGLLQISPQTARAQGCTAQSAAALKDGAANLTCAVQILAEDVARDGVVAGPGNRGVGRDWMPFRKADKRAEMAGWTRAQPFCQPG
jgi:soluble lytic murein transglycosylase-like protein